MTSTPVDQSPESIVAGAPGRSIDPMTVINQIGVTVRMRVGYVVDSLMYSRDYIKFQISLDRKPRRWVIVKLAADDTYSIEVGRLQKRIYWRIEKQLEGVCAEQLPAVIERLFVEVYS